MGAMGFSVYSYGKTAQDAWAKAIEEDHYWNGHDTYSGSIQTKEWYGFIKFERPGPIPVDKLLRWVYDAESILGLEEADEDDDWINPQERKQALREFRQSVPAKYREWAKHVARETYDKGGPAGCIEVEYKKAMEIKSQHNLKGKRGMKVFLFFGMAPS